jgi:tripartite ATP-independent transporter DctM subunit
MMDAFILLGSFVALILIGMPVAYALGLSALIGAWWIEIPFDALMIQVAGGVNKFSLLAIPFFVLAGAIMAEGGMSRRLVAFAGVLVGFVRGGLSLVNIVASTFFGAISGSSVADTASVGSVLIPEMERNGYPRDFSTAVTVSGSVQALLTPPSHNSVLYSLAAGGTVSIASLFMAGIMPGLLLSAVMMGLCMIFARKRNYPKGEVIPLRKALKIAGEALWGMMAMVIILGGILSGVFTATESAAIAVLWAFFVTMFIYRDYKWRDLPKLMHRAVRTVSIVMILIGFAASFGYILTLMEIPMKITTAFLTLSDNRYVILMCINIMLLLLGTVMDMAPLILILTPILLPVIVGIGVDPVHFGMIMLVNLGIGLITPPVGAVLFVGAAVGKVTIEATVKALLPFYVALFMVLMAVTYIPAISLWLPSVVL